MSAWASEMKHTVTVAHQTGVDGAAKPVYGAPAEVACFYVDGANVVRNADGEIVEVASTFYTHTAIHTDDAIWVEGADTTDDAEAVTPASVTHYPDLAGDDDLWEVTL